MPWARFPAARERSRSVVRTAPPTAWIRCPVVVSRLIALASKPEFGGVRDVRRDDGGVCRNRLVGSTFASNAFASNAAFNPSTATDPQRVVSFISVVGCGTNRRYVSIGVDGRPVVLGDLNDTEQAATTQLLYRPPGSQYGTGGFAHPDPCAERRLWNLAPPNPRGAPLLPHLRRATGADRPHPDQPCPAHPIAVCGHQA